MLPCICSGIDHTRVGVKMWREYQRHTQLSPPVPLCCSYHIFASYLLNMVMAGIYLLNLCMTKSSHLGLCNPPSPPLPHHFSNRHPNTVYCKKRTLTFVSHWQRSPFSCPVIMYWSNGPQRAAVTLGPSMGMVRKGSLEPLNKQRVSGNIHVHVFIVVQVNYCFRHK